MQYTIGISTFLSLLPILALAQTHQPGHRSTAEGLYNSLINNPNLKENAKGEGFCWHAGAGMEGFVGSYVATKDTSWLNWGVKYYDFLLGNRDIDPDGYLGWIGPDWENQGVFTDALVGEGILMSGILEFCELVTQDQALKKVYGQKAAAYVATAKRDVIEKWDRRGAWHEDGPLGVYTFISNRLKPGLKEWIMPMKDSRPSLSLPFNQFEEPALMCLRLSRITGEEFYRQKAMKMFSFAKSRFQFFDDHYVWSYWEPFGPWDIDLEKRRPRHFVGVHAFRSGYQAMEVRNIVQAYQAGLVFDSTDIQRIINTNLNVMWNQDREKPEFRNSNGLGAEKDTAGLEGFKKAFGHSNAAVHQGQLWTDLADFSQTIRDLAAAGRGSGPAVYAEPPDFKRKALRGPVTVFPWQFSACKDLNMAAAIPGIFKSGDTTIIICKSWTSGALEIALYSRDNTRKIATLHQGAMKGGADGIEGFYLYQWDGKDPVKKTPYKGEYVIRWTLGTGYRTYPVTIH